ncbi:polarity establishment/cellular polarization [Neocucurbitaria cava]|uniref:Polarity establishment/cellular polarization n=1 Tax=Neocucurbitaria cava TaxID=798079 RepID=A0A9W8Y1Z6_9PLEO|nr:polarity establishment/cellular polarization [Neocucurbitaria cava]
MSTQTALYTVPTGFIFKDFVSLPPKSCLVIAEKVARLEKKVFPTSEAFDYNVELRKKNTGVILAFKETDSDNLVAYLVYQRMKRLVWLHKLCVVEQEREKGLGKNLVRFLACEMKKGGCQSIQLWLDDNRKPAKALYASCGFQQVDIMTRRFICLAILTVSVAANPQVNYPLSLQYPPVALVGEPFSFQFADTTFSSDSGDLQYSLTGNPSWLSLDDQSRTLSGTPRASDVGFASFTITAAGQAGTVANMASKLYVSTDDAPTATGNISAALSTAGTLSGPTTVTLSPSTPFNISFGSDTFDSNGKKLSYFATLADHTPLPAWISFDASSIHFAGSTPPMSSPQSFEILLIACETPGFAASSVSFTIFVSKHSLTFNPFNQIINITKGAEVRITNLKKELFLDGSPITDTDLEYITAELPSWLTLNNSTFEIVGTSPSDAMSQDLTVTARDRSGDTAQQTIHLGVKSELFEHEIGSVTLKAGEDFKYKIPQDVLTKDDENVTVGFASLAKYLHFDPTTLTISGTIPKDFPPQDVECSMTATSSDGTLKDSQSFVIQVSGAAHGNGLTSSKNGGGDASNAQSDGTASDKAGVIAGSVIGALSGVAVLLGFALCLRRRKRNSKSYVSPKLPRSPRKSDISRPMFIPHGWPDMDETADHDLEKGKDDDDSVMERTPEKPPKLEVDLLSDHLDSHSVADSIGDADTRILDIFDESSWGIQNDTAPSQHPSDSMKIPTELAKRSSQMSDTFRKHKRRTTTVYQDQIHRSSGLPVNRRITGMGHGRHTYSPAALSPTTRNTIVRPDDDVVEGKEKEIPQTLRIVQPSGTLPETPKKEFIGSLRTNRANRPITAIPANRDRVEKSYARPGTAISSGSRSSFGRRASTRQSLRAYDLKASLNDLTGSKIFEDAEMSDSVYSDEEMDIEEAEKRTTVKPGYYTLPPLNLDRVDTKRNSKRNSKRDSTAAKSKAKRDSKRELKRTNERDPTPYFFASTHEHGGKENASSTYTLGQRSSPVRIELKGKAKATTTLTENTKPSTARHSKTATEARKSHRTSVNRASNVPSSQGSTKERHSRKSIHSRSQSRHSGGTSVKKPRDHSRTQSSAFPRFDATIFESLGSGSDDRPSSIGNAITTAADAVCLPASTTKPSIIMRDLSGNLTFYGGDDDEPTIEELGSSSIGFRTSNGRINSAARRSRLASLHLSSSASQVPQLPPKSSKRETVIPIPTTPPPGEGAQQALPAGLGLGVGLFPHECPGDEKEKKRKPLSVVQAGNAATPTPEPEEQQVHGRKTWGSLKSIVGRGVGGLVVVGVLG